MKSAYELALERSGGDLEDISEEKKAEIAEIESLYKSRIVQAEMAAQDRSAKVNGDPAKLEQIAEDLTVELASLRDKCEREKEKIRKG